MRLLRNLLIPDEWLSAFGTWREMASEVRLTSFSTFKHALGFTFVWSAGAWLGSLAWSSINVAVAAGNLTLLDSLLKAVLTLVGVLSGFMIALMLFSGKTEAWKALNLEQAQKFVEKSNYLLFSQFVTLVNHVLVAGTAVTWFVFAATGRAGETKLIFIALFGFLLISLFRTILVPLQIAELHRFALLALIAEKEKEVNDQVKKLAKD